MRSAPCLPVLRVSKSRWRRIATATSPMARLVLGESARCRWGPIAQMSERGCRSRQEVGAESSVVTPVALGSPFRLMRARAALPALPDAFPPLSLPRSGDPARVHKSRWTGRLYSLPRSASPSPKLTLPLSLTMVECLLIKARGQPHPRRPARRPFAVPGRVLVAKRHHGTGVKRVLLLCFDDTALYVTARWALAELEQQTGRRMEVCAA